MPIKLDYLREFQPNWDSFGAPAVDERAIRVAEELLNRQPEVVPTHEGGVTIQWHLQNANIELEIRADGTQVLEIH